MAKYLVDCACGRQHTVETRQAGESLVCECGTTVPVPTLRQLRQLPEARAETASTAASGPAWGGRQRAITVSLLLAAVCLAVAGVSRSLEMPVPILDTAAYTKNVDRLVGTMSPLQAWSAGKTPTNRCARRASKFTSTPRRPRSKSRSPGTTECS